MFLRPNIIVKDVYKKNDKNTTDAVKSLLIKQLKKNEYKNT